MDGDPAFERAATAMGLPPNRLISWSKSGYRRLHPDHIPVFNATIAGDDHSQLWRGDLDLTRDEQTLIKLSKATGRTLHVLYEVMFFREDMPIEEAVLTVDPNGAVTVHRSETERDSRGALVQASRPMSPRVTEASDDSGE